MRYSGRLKLRHDVIITSIALLVLKTIFRYLLMTGYLIACDRFGLYSYGFIVKVIVTITSICLSRATLREIGRIVGDKLDEEMFSDVGIVSCVRGIRQLLGRW